MPSQPPTPSPTPTPKPSPSILDKTTPAFNERIKQLLIQGKFTEAYHLYCAETHERDIGAIQRYFKAIRETLDQPLPTPTISPSVSYERTVRSPGICTRCQKSLSGLRAGAYSGNDFLSMLSTTPYPCRSCGAIFCQDCMLEIKRFPCPHCEKPLGW